MRSRSRRLSSLAFATLLFGLAGVVAAGMPPEITWVYQPRERLSPPLPQPPVPVALVLDDGVAEGDFGVTLFNGTAKQFLWFNQFDVSSLASGFMLEEVQVQFGSGANMAVGNAVRIVIYHDPDSDPTNGATLLRVFDASVLAVDGSFSVYPLSPAIAIPRSGSLLVGVVSSFVVSGVTSATRPAALDTSASQGFSWLAVWVGDPPASPVLPPNLLLERVDAYVPGNWMIRAFGTGTMAAVVEIPTLDTFALVLLVVLVAGAAVRKLACARA